MSELAIRAEGVGKRYRIGQRHQRYRTLRESVAEKFSALFRRPQGPSVTSRRGAGELFWALKDVSFELRFGETLGVIGRNGAGKSTLLKILSRITEPTEGEVDVFARVGSLIEVGTGFHPELTGRENVFLNGAILGMRRRETVAKFDEIVAFAGVERFIDTPVKRYSSGMYLRLAFAVAAHLPAGILLVDEILSVGDAAFQKKCIDKMNRITGEGKAVVFVSHRLSVIAQLCNRGLVLDNGTVACLGSADDAIAAYGKLVASGKDETGSGERSGIGISGFSVEALDGPDVSPRCPLRFRFSLTVWERYWGVAMQLGLSTYEGLQVILEVAESDRFPELLEPGRYDVEVRLPALWLRPRAYLTGVVVSADPESGVREVYRSNLLEIQVKPGSVRETSWDRLLAPDARWTIKPLDGSQRGRSNSG